MYTPLSAASGSAAFIQAPCVSTSVGLQCCATAPHWLLQTLTLSLYEIEPLFDIKNICRHFLLSTLSISVE